MTSFFAGYKYWPKNIRGVYLYGIHCLAGLCWYRNQKPPLIWITTTWSPVRSQILPNHQPPIFRGELLVSGRVVFRIFLNRIDKNLQAWNMKVKKEFLDHKNKNEQIWTDDLPTFFLVMATPKQWFHRFSLNPLGPRLNQYIKGTECRGSNTKLLVATICWHSQLIEDVEN